MGKERGNKRGDRVVIGTTSGVKGGWLYCGILGGGP